MAGRRLVDAAKLFNASKSIAAKHITLRSQQLDLYTKTSSLAKAVKSQTDRVTLTAQAAIALSRRVNEEAPSFTAATPSKPSTTARDGDVHKSTAGGVDGKEELDVRQKVAASDPLPDGTIPPAGVSLGPDGASSTQSKEPEQTSSNTTGFRSESKGNHDGLEPASSTASTIPDPSEQSQAAADHARDLQRQFESHIPSTDEVIQSPPHDAQAESLTKGHDRDVFYLRSKESQPEPSSLPRVKIPKHTEDKQESVRNVEDSGLNQEVYYSTPSPGVQTDQRAIPQEVTVAEQNQVPEGINTDVFRTKRVAKMLGGNPYASKPQMNLQGARGTPLDNTKLAEGRDQDTINVRTTEQSEPSKPLEPKEKVSTTPEEMQTFASKLAKDVEAASSPSQMTEKMAAESSAAAYELRESKVPSSRFGRLWQYAGLGTSMALGAVGESLRRVTGGAAAAGGSLMLSPRNLEILVSKLSRMRGAALKLGQMISIQDMKMLPPEIHHVLQRVQDSADYMPASQRDKVLASNLGPNWRDLFESFEDVPIAAASIGQVHKAVLRSTKEPVAVKVQYPGVANSIDSDLNNLSILLTASRLLPKGLYLDKTIANARTELGWECDYSREAECQMRFRELLADDTDVFLVPKVFPEASGPEVLTAELMTGIGVAKLPTLSQEQRDWIGTQILRLCLREITEFKFMQTDPNWTNFLYNAENRKIELLDFGASREYPDEFVEPYINVLIAASKGDKVAIRDLSIQLGYLTGSETKTMVDAHVESVLTLAEPFKASGPEVYDFRDQTITDRVRSLIPVMVKERLAPPPEETYSLHRKLSGAFLLCARLGSRVPCREMFVTAIEKYPKGRA
ncbi:ubiquinone biosynthesis protein-like protein coq-8 [Sporormia fimetaria CBS 119925]|uniref:Ubiquinone biosynthesis protein-like protein coq-8 n=1 Tax=Sporormia fimetaria CBS 119925 TaxID=1340428 RepID=A0A6A6VIJ3_9PLEO|nr:ubiquinone biosynthesis protein-like protein coq-8 [Sporormia fimetaria CBS 119925]